MNLDKMSVEELIFLLEVVTKDNPNKPLASATQVLRLCKAIQELKQEKVKLKTKIEDLRTTINPVGWGTPVEKSPNTLKIEILKLFD